MYYTGCVRRIRRRSLKSIFQNYFQSPIEESPIPEFVLGLLCGIALVTGVVIWILISN
jgi:hypothetical protein